jgi:hypothetical protein
MPIQPSGRCTVTAWRVPTIQIAQIVTVTKASRPPTTI